MLAIERECILSHKQIDELMRCMEIVRKIDWSNIPKIDLSKLKVTISNIKVGDDIGYI